MSASSTRSLDSSPQNYIDKVPVKISEKYKPPPKITLSNSILHKLNNLNELLESNLIEYDFNLERNVLAKLNELKNARDVEREQRRQRMRKYELLKLREIEQKQKQLLTAVSYPNADDLLSSSSSDDDNDVEEITQETIKAGELEKRISTATVLQQQQQKQFSPSHQNFDTILEPTRVPDTDASLKLCQLVKSQLSAGISKINYSDFENDTSSPFDNVELKTINDLDILAQVLKVSSLDTNAMQTNEDTTTNKQEQQQEQEHSSSDSKESPNNEDSIEISSNNGVTELESNNQPPLQTVNGSDTRNFVNDNFQYNNLARIQNNPYIDPYYNFNYSIIGASNMHQQQQQQHNHHQQQQQQQQQNFYTPYDNNTAILTQNYTNMNDLPRRNNDFYSFYNNQIYDNSSYLYNYSNTPTANTTERSYGNLSVSQMQSIQQQQQQQHQQIEQSQVNFYQNLYTSASPLLTPNRNTTPNNYETINVGISVISSKSKSVPDIFKELNDEVCDSERRRCNEQKKCQELETYYNQKELEENQLSKSNSGSAELSETFMKLSPSSQLLAKNISLMGFPLERVCKIAEKYGNDDKKIVEHLIPLSELLDLGFDESKISDALIKFDNNKEKALDFLIS